MTFFSSDVIGACETRPSTVAMYRPPDLIFEYVGPRQSGSGARIIGTKTYGVLTRGESVR
ncbi:MAG: hypothetical protein CBHOC_0244 [uncultured Caballeronia sp.]|nr:MAG: hypothetical protein CBHOC_0244 [uncultured Caballeronia sp.]